MALRFRVKVDPDGPPSSPLGALLSNMLLPARGTGRPAPTSALFSGDLPRLVYFRNKGCTVCDLVDMRVGQACARANVTLGIVDRWPKEGRPTESAPYLDEVGNVVDADGSVNSAFGVAVYPTFVLIGTDGRVAWRGVGVRGETDTFDAYLARQFERLPR